MVAAQILRVAGHASLFELIEEPGTAAVATAVHIARHGGLDPFPRRLGGPQHPRFFKAGNLLRHSALKLFIGALEELPHDRMGRAIVEQCVGILAYHTRMVSERPDSGLPTSTDPRGLLTHAVPVAGRP